MAKRRLIPKLLLKKSAHRDAMVLVTTIGFSQVVEVGDPVSQAKIYEAQLVDELLFLDIDSAEASRRATLDIIQRTAEQVFMPFTVGGGISRLEDIRELLNHGADKVSIGRSALRDPSFISRAADRFGNQCVVASVDYRRMESGEARVYTDGGKTATSWHPLDWAVECEKRGAGEVLLNAIDRDGSRQGLDLKISKEIVDALSIPVLLSGGCGTAQHFIEGFQNSGASAVVAGTYFCFRDENPLQCRSRILNAGIAIREVNR